MKARLGSTVGGMVTLGLLLGIAHPAQAQEEKELGWFNRAELAWVLTAGNAKTSTLGLKDVLRRVWPRSEVRLEVGGIRTESTFKTRTAVGPSAADFEVREEDLSETTAESYRVNGRYDHLFSDRWYGYTLAGWERNEFAGFDNRYTFVGGLGAILVDGERTRFKVDLGATYTVQKDLVEGPGDGDGFGGLRFTWDYLQHLTSTTDVTSVLIVDESLNETEDLRADFTNALAVSISEMLALQTSVRLLWDNRPSLVGVPLFLPDGTDTGQSVLAELAELDTYFTVALVVMM